MKLYCSGSGETATMAALQKLLADNMKAYNFDNIGVPENADKKWRKESTRPQMYPKCTH